MGAQPEIAADRSTRVWKRIRLQDRLKLEIAVGFGLPIDFAGKIINMSSRNANRIMKERQARRELEHQTTRLLPQTEQLQIQETKRQAWDEAELDALLAVSEAREAGRIRKRNINKLDRKVNETICRYLREEAPQHSMGLHEKVGLYAGQRK